MIFNHWHHHLKGLATALTSLLKLVYHELKIVNQ